jgi:hypothetical protein
MPNDKTPGSGSVQVPTEPLPSTRVLIERAKEDARRRRAELGLPPLPEDEQEQPRARRQR